MSEELLSSIRHKSKQHIADALHNIPRVARSEAWYSAVAEASFLCQRFYEKDQPKGFIFTSILDHFQNDEVFHASQ